jgi:hypothetical protein
LKVALLGFIEQLICDPAQALGTAAKRDVQRLTERLSLFGLPIGR